MALQTKSIFADGSTGHHKFTLNVIEDSTSITNNTSSVSWNLVLSPIGNGWDWYYSNQVPVTYSVTINGNKYTGNIMNYDGSSTVTIKSGTLPIEHNDDGNKVISYSFSISSLNYSYLPGSASASGSMTLTFIPRASDFTISEGTLGVAQTITVKRQNAAFSHGLTYSCGSVKTQLICSWNTTKESVSFTPPIDLAWQAPNGTRVWVSVHLQTYDSAGNTIGGVITKGLWMSIPASVKPSCSATVSDPTGYATKFGAFIQGQSKLAIRVTPTTSYGSNISAYSVTADGNTFNTAEVTTPVVKSTGSLTVNATVTDTRSRTGSASTTVTVLPYTQPVINVLKVHRCDEDGTENHRGSHAKVTYGYTVDTLDGKNGVSAYIQYKKTTETEYTSVELPTEFSVTDGEYIFAADDGSAYDIQLLLADDLVSVGHRTTVSTAFTLIHFAPDGKGITFGGINNEPGFHIMNMPFSIDGVDVDYIVEQGEIDGWFYRKWNSGTAECWKIYYGYGVDLSANHYTGFYYSDTIRVNYPFVFTNYPTLTVDGGSSAWMNFVRVFGLYKDSASFVVVGNASTTSTDITVHIKAIGKWK